MCKVIIINFDRYYHKCRTPDSKESFEILMSTLKKDEKSKLYLWSCYNKKLSDFIETCCKYEIYFDSVNDNLSNIKNDKYKKTIIDEIGKLSLIDWSFMFGFAVIIS